MIQNAVKKTLIPLADSQWFTILAKDKDLIEEEEYEIAIGVVSAVFNTEAMQVIFYIILG